MKRILVLSLLLLSGSLQARPLPAHTECRDPEVLDHLWKRSGGELIGGAGLFAAGIKLGHPLAHMRAAAGLEKAFQMGTLSRTQALAQLRSKLGALLALSVLEATAIALTADGLVYWFSGGRRSLLGSLAGHHPLQTCQNILDLHEALTAESEGVLQ